MPSLTSFHLLHERVSKRQSDQLLETLGDGFDWVALETVLDLSGDEIDDAIVDDGMDGGIDGVDFPPQGLQFYIRFDRRLGHRRS